VGNVVNATPGLDLIDDASHSVTGDYGPTLNPDAAAYSSIARERDQDTRNVGITLDVDRAYDYSTGTAIETIDVGPPIDL
jgi:hypothetical protein